MGRKGAGMTNRVAIGLLILMACISSRALAHHSFAAEFDATKAIRLTGTLTKVEWTNPHTYFYLDVKDDKGDFVLRPGPRIFVL